MERASAFQNGVRLQTKTTAFLWASFWRLRTASFRSRDDFDFAGFHDKELEIAITSRNENFTIPVTLQGSGAAIRHLSDLTPVENR
jgi:hypothetical protein